MKCIFCGIDSLSKLIIIKGVNIHECKNCSLGFINQLEEKFNHSSAIYTLNQYRKNENRLKRRYVKLIRCISKCKRKGNVLDVGGGYGLISFLLFKQNNYSVDILEPFNKPFYIKGTNIHHIKLDVSNFNRTNEKKYDIILMFDVLEHLKEPIRELKSLRNSLNKGGILAIQTPNYKSLMAKICKSWSWWMIEDHRYFFSFKSLAYLMKTLKLNIVYKSTYEDLTDFKKNLDGNFVNINYSLFRKLLKVLFFLFFFPNYLFFRMILWRLNYGGLIFMIVKK